MLPVKKYDFIGSLCSPSADTKKNLEWLSREILSSQPFDLVTYRHMKN